MTDDADLVAITLHIEDALVEINRLRAKTLRLAEVTGAGAAVLNAIHRAGGWHVADHQHQERLRLALEALEEAVVSVLNAERAG